MKKRLFAISLVGIVLFLGHSIIFAQDSGQCDRNTLSPIQCGYYEEGYQDGAGDAQNNRGNDYRRYRTKLDGSRYESYYKDGYEAGFSNSSGRPFPRRDRQRREAYDLGFRNGESDKRRNISRLPERYEGDYNRSTEETFKQGYYDGFDGRPRQYNGRDDNSNVDPNSPTFPNDPYNPNNPVKQGTANGTVSWSGKVDDRTNIVIQDDQVTEQIVSGNGGYVTNKSINGVLPRVASRISAAKLDGRGTVNVLQQPSRSNNYTAIVQVSDTKSGQGDYRLQISWQATEPLEEPYQTGRVSWRGKVDQTANIIISGNSVQTQNVAGNGVEVTSSNINGYLARRPGTVKISKRGRGSVTVLQQPTAENGFVAIVQIFDADRSSGDYEIEITW